MEFTLQKVGIINNSTIKLDGLTVVCGSNNSGKSTIGKALYSSIESLCQIDEKIKDELHIIYRRALRSIVRWLDLESISKYVDFDRMQEEITVDITMLLQNAYILRRRSNNIIDSFNKLRDAVEFLNKDVIMDYTQKYKSDLPKKFFAFIENYDENRKKSIKYLNDYDSYFNNLDYEFFAKRSISSLFSTEFKSQIFPVNLKSKEKKSSFRLTQNQETGFNFSILNNGEKVLLNNSKLFVNNAIYIDDPYILDRIEEYNYAFSHYDDNDNSDSHARKLIRMLNRESSQTLIEQVINEERYNSIVSKISSVIPGSISIKDTGVYYEEPNKEPLRVQNLATGSKLFSILKTLIEKGDINYDTMLILDEPEAHLHPEWQNVFAEIIVLLVKELNVHVLLTTHSPNFLMAMEAFSKKHTISNKSNYYYAELTEDAYMVDYTCANDRLSKIYSSFANPLIDVKRIKENG